MILSKSKIGQVVKIKKINENCPIKIKRRLLDLGFIEGINIKLLRKSILSKVLLIEIRGYTLSLQRKIAEYIELGG